MHNPFDQLAKKIGKEALDASGLTVVQYEISRDAQHADIRHDPDPARDRERARLGLLGRLAATLCLLEIYGHAPSGAEIRACLSKHFAHWDEQERKARAHNKRRQQKGLPLLPFVEPRLWIIAALPEDAHERAVAEQILVHLQHVIGKKPGRTPEEEEFVVTILSTWTEARALGRDEGRTEEAARAVLTVLRVRGVAVPDAAREVILAQKDPERLEQWLEKAAVAVSVADVIDELS